MATKNGGEDNTMSDESILQIDSPQDLLEGPYRVVHKDTKERWAIVAFHWDGRPCLGIRWFWDKCGFPISRSWATWLVLSDTLTRALLVGLPLKHEFADKVNSFLSGKLDGKELRN